MPQRATEPRLSDGRGSTITSVMRRVLSLIPILAVVVAACGSPTVTQGGPGTGGTGGTGGAGGAGSCTEDTDCQSGQYCRGFSHVCPNSYSNYTATPGTCHRDCSLAGCACVDDTDCRAWEHCSQGTCAAGNPDGATCPTEPFNCPSGCSLSPATDQICESTCRCAVCPAGDGGPG